MSTKMEIVSGGKKINLSDTEKLFLIAGPCVIESERMTFKIAEYLRQVTSELQIPFIFKASYKKANRTRKESFRSIGVQKSLEILKKVSEKFKIPVLTDVHSEIEVSIASDYVDILQIPAFLSRQTELLEAAGESGRIINIKKGQFLSPKDLKYQIEKIASTGNRKILITERGTTFGYNDLVVDMRSLPQMKQFGYPVIFDCTHSLQKPSLRNGISDGSPDLIFPVMRAAVACGVNGIFVETHPTPLKARSDAHSMLPLKKIKALLIQALLLHELRMEFTK